MGSSRISSGLNQSCSLKHSEGSFPSAAAGASAGAARTLAAVTAAQSNALEIRMIVVVGTSKRGLAQNKEMGFFSDINRRF